MSAAKWWGARLSAGTEGAMSETTWTSCRRKGGSWQFGFYGATVDVRLYAAARLAGTYLGLRLARRVS